MSCYPLGGLSAFLQHTGKQDLAEELEEGASFCFDFLFSCPQPRSRVSEDTAAAGAEVKISALFVARISTPSPSGGAFGIMQGGGRAGPGLSYHDALQHPAFPILPILL